MTFEVNRVVWHAETGLVDFGGRGYWDHTTSSAPFDREDLAVAHLLKLGGVRLDPDKGLVNEFPMGLVRVRKESFVDHEATALFVSLMSREGVQL